MTYPDAKAVSYAYDAAGNRTSLTNPGNVTFTYTYDAANRLTQITQGTRTWTFGYDTAGNRTSLNHPNGAKILYTYLNNNWLGTITHKRSGDVTFDTITYGYDQNGNRTTLTDYTGSTAFGYDALNRLTSAAYPGTYGTWSWTYDAVGNRLTQNSPSGQTTYGYDANNRLISSGSTTYSYDPNGNLTSISTGASFGYDAHNRMNQANLPGGLTVQYTYNGDGLKIRRIDGSAVTRYYHDGIRPIYEAKGDGSLQAQLERDIFGNLLARQDWNGTRYYYHHDGLGSTVGLTDANGQVAAQRTYDAWGNRRASSGSAPGNYQFAGAELDPTSGLYHMGARFYDPTIGRWLTEEPKQDEYFNPRALNFYAYTWGAPTGLVDRNGLFPSPSQLILGNSVHAAVERWFRATFPGSRTQLTIEGLGLRLDMMKPGPGGVWEVYELKSATTLADPSKRRKAITQLQDYLDALRASGWNAQAGGSWNPQGQVVPWNSLFNAVLTSDPAAPGIIGYSLSPTNNAISVLVTGYAVPAAIAAAVLAILLRACEGGSASPLCGAQ